MKVLLINGSPHEAGNTYRSLKEVADTLEEEGIDTEIAWIGNKEIRGCAACGSCGRNKNLRCVFDDDICNEMIAKAADADGLVIGSPVYFAGVAGTLTALLDRMFYAGSAAFRYKPAAGIGVARRAGTIEAADRINKYFQICNMPVVPSNYWGIAYGRTDQEAAADGEGMQTMRVMARNMAWMIKSFDAAKKAGINPPELEEKIRTNFVRDDLK